MGYGKADNHKQIMEKKVLQTMRKTDAWNFLMRKSFLWLSS